MESTDSGVSVQSPICLPFFNIKTEQYLTGHWNCSLNVSFNNTEPLNLLLVNELLRRK